MDKTIRRYPDAVASVLKDHPELTEEEVRDVYEQDAIEKDIREEENERQCDIDEAYHRACAASAAYYSLIGYRE